MRPGSKVDQEAHISTLLIPDAGLDGIAGS